MTPRKATGKINKKKARLGSEEGQGSGGNLEPNFEFNQSNQYLFRDIQGYENFMFLFKNRSLSDCYYSDKATVTFRQPEDDKIIAYITHCN